eukprot:172573-Prymnesium_polylepis.1
MLIRRRLRGVALRGRWRAGRRSCAREQAYHMLHVRVLGSLDRGVVRSAVGQRRLKRVVEAGGQRGDELLRCDGLGGAVGP